MADQTLHATSQLQADLGQLGRLARARLAADDDDLVAPDGLGQIVATLADGQLLVVGNPGHPGEPLLGPGDGTLDLIADRCKAAVGVVRIVGPLAAVAAIVRWFEPAQTLPEPMTIGDHRLVEALFEEFLRGHGGLAVRRSTCDRRVILHGGVRCS